MNKFQRYALTAAATLPTAILAVILRRAFQVWGIFDPIGDAFGGWLKGHVSAPQAEWTTASLIALALYGVFLWSVWHVHHVHHLPILPETRPVASVSMEVKRANANVPHIGPEPPIDPHALKLSVGQEGAFFDTDGSGLTYTLRTYNLKIENADRHHALTKVNVTVLALEPPEYEGPWPIRSGLTLGAGEHQFVPLVTYSEGRGSPGATFMNIHAPKNTPRPAAPGPCYLTVRATSKETAYFDLKCKVWVANGLLQLEQVTNTTSLVSLHEAAIRLHEAEEAAGVNEVPPASNLSPTDATLEHCKYVFLTAAREGRISLWGTRPPSRNPTRIQKDELAQYSPAPGRSRLNPSFASGAGINDVMIPEAELQSEINFRIALLQSFMIGGV